MPLLLSLPPNVRLGQKLCGDGGEAAIRLLK